MNIFRRSTAAALALALAGAAPAAPVTYQVDPDHTYPSFEADHMGISVWRGKLTRSSGTIVFDQATGTGTVDIAIDPASIDFGLKQLDAWARGNDFLDVKQYPTARYRGRFDGGGARAMPTQVLGELSLHGVTKPLALKLNLLK
jgi:polyisoprenoid-binding protein YceI